jgi:hypothetical protein
MPIVERPDASMLVSAPPAGISAIPPQVQHSFGAALLSPITDPGSIPGSLANFGKGFVKGTNEAMFSLPGMLIPGIKEIKPDKESWAGTAGEWVGWVAPYEGWLGLVSGVARKAGAKIGEIGLHSIAGSTQMAGAEAMKDTEGEERHIGEAALFGLAAPPLLHGMSNAAKFLWSRTLGKATSPFVRAHGGTAENPVTPFDGQGHGGDGRERREADG